MQIKIKADAYASGNNPQYTKWIEDNRGKWVEVETDHLFNNQYNTDTARIYDTQIDAVRDDARVNMGKCSYCGTMMHQKELICLKHAECPEHGVNWFTPENTFFLKYPNGLSVPTKEVTQKIGTYFLSKSLIDEHYELRNCRKRMLFKFDGRMFYVRDGIGYKRMRFLDVPTNVEKKVREKLGELMSR